MGGLRWGAAIMGRSDSNWVVEGRPNFRKHCLWSCVQRTCPLNQTLLIKELAPRLRQSP